MLARAVASIRRSSSALAVAACGAGSAARAVAASARPRAAAGRDQRRLGPRRAGRRDERRLHDDHQRPRAPDDALVGVATPGSPASAGLHETTTDASGMTGMHPVDVGRRSPPAAPSPSSPAATTSCSWTCSEELAAGSASTLILTFEQAGPVTVNAEVRAG